MFYDERFPAKPLAEKDLYFIAEMCGTDPREKPLHITRPDRLESLLQFGNQLLRHNIDLARVAIVSAQASARELDLPLSTTPHFNRGMQLYASVLHVSGQLNELPCETEAIDTIIDMQADKFVKKSLTIAGESGKGSFGKLAEAARPALGTAHSERLHQLTLAGAGLVELVSATSIPIRERHDLHMLDLSIELEPSLKALVGHTFDDVIGDQLNGISDLYTFPGEV